MRNDNTKRRYMSVPNIFGLRNWLVRNFDDAAQAHDANYEQQYLSRRVADKIFLRDMKVLIKKNHSKGRKRLGYTIVAYLVWLSVRLFGWSSWSLNKSLKGN